MRKYISSIFWAAVLLLTVLPLQTRAADDAMYRAELVYVQQGKEIGYGDEISVQVKLSSVTEDVTQYSAYDLKLSYDSSRLEFIPDQDERIKLSENRVRVKGYGEDKECTEPVVTLCFKVVKPGDAKIELLEKSCADFSDYAEKRTAPFVQPRGVGETNQKRAVCRILD